MSAVPFHQLSMRERQIMEVLHRLGWSSAAAVADALPDDVSYDSVRVTLAILKRKGVVSHQKDGKRYLYSPAERTDRAGLRALRQLLRTYFEDSAPQAVSSLLDSPSGALSEKELDELAALVQAARRKNKKKSAR